ncbi:hypothetical protein Btru_003079 [Bulinus truncatus]|nr:hypothetical protein Btru_003079 [Bulinus truncatus]
MNPLSEKNGELTDKKNSEEQTGEEWLEMKNKLEDELHRLLVARSSVNQESSAGNFDDILCRIKDLKETLLEASIKNSRNELVLKRIQIGKTLCEKIFDSEDKSNLFLERSLKQLELAIQLLRIHKETKECQEKLEAVKLANIKLYKENLELMTKLKTNNERKQKLSVDVEENEDYKSLNKQLEMKSMSIEIYRNIIKLLIVGLGQDWSQDSNLTDLLLQCGEPISVYL